MNDMNPKLRVEREKCAMTVSGGWNGIMVNIHAGTDCKAVTLKPSEARELHTLLGDWLSAA